MKRSTIVAHIRENGIKINNPFEIEYTEKLFEPKKKEEVEIVDHRLQYQDPIFGQLNEGRHFIVLEDGTEISFWEHEIK